MIQFDPYPITINGSKMDDAFREMLAAQVAKGKMTEVEAIEAKSRMNLNKFDYLPDPSPWAAAYEKRISGLLAYIVANKAGRCLLNTLRAKGTLTVWIIPYDSDQVEYGGIDNANVNWAPEAYVGKKAVRLAFSPDTWTYHFHGKMPGSRADEVLFHEMVHAYRFARTDIKERIYKGSLPGHYTDHEEFLADQLSNVYRSTRGAKKFTLDYKKKKLGTAAQCEAAIRSSKELLDALALFLSIDPLSKAIAKLETHYNPFRDFERLKRR